MSETLVFGEKVLVAKTASGEVGGIGAARGSQARQWTAYVEWATGVTSGAVMLESAPYEGYAGTWKSHATITFGGTAPNADTAQVLGPLGAIRLRISTVVAGGGAPTVTGWLYGN